MTLAAVLPRVRSRRRRPWSPETRIWFALAALHFAILGLNVVICLRSSHTGAVVVNAFGVLFNVLIGRFYWGMFQASRRRDEDG